MEKSTRKLGHRTAAQWAWQVDFVYKFSLLGASDATLADQIDVDDVQVAASLFKSATGGHFS